MIEIRKLRSPKFNKITWQYYSNRLISIVDQRYLSEEESPNGNSGWIYSFMVPSLNSNNQYKCDVFILKDEFDSITDKMKCQVKCTCPSFIYQFQSTLYRKGALYDDVPYDKSLPKKPKFGCCKHLEAVFNEIFQRQIKGL